MNEDFKIDEKFYYILYYQQFPEFKTFYVKINRSDNNIVFNKEIPNSFNKRRNMISPYDPNLIMSFYDNNKIINYRMSE